jgi:LysR family transcriptional regulator, hydrogen peroxide-inducible genes activator
MSQTNVNSLPWTIRQVQYAVAVAETGGLRKAAERCHVSQPALSAALVDLEAALATVLFERSRTGVRLTRAGADLVEPMRTLLREAGHLHEAARRVGDPLAATLRIGVIPTLAPYLLPELVGPLRRKFPALRVVWVEDRTPNLKARLASGELDAALLALESDLGAVTQAALGRDPFFLALPADHALAKRREPIRVAELADLPLLLLEEGHCLRDQTMGVCGGARLAESDIQAASLATLSQMVAGGLGVTLLPRTTIAVENRTARLALVPFAAPVPYRTVGLVWRTETALGPSLRKLSGVVRQALRGVMDPLGPGVAADAADGAAVSAGEAVDSRGPGG